MLYTYQLRYFGSIAGALVGSVLVMCCASREQSSNGESRAAYDVTTAEGMLDAAHQNEAVASLGRRRGDQAAREQDGLCLRSRTVLDPLHLDLVALPLERCELSFGVGLGDSSLKAREDAGEGRIVDGSSQREKYGRRVDN